MPDFYLKCSKFIFSAVAPLDLLAGFGDPVKGREGKRKGEGKGEGVEG